MTKQPKEPAIISDPLTQAWRRGELVRGHVMTPQPITPKPTEQATSPAPDAVLRERVLRYRDANFSLSAGPVGYQLLTDVIAALASSKPTGCEGEGALRARTEEKGL